MKPIDILTWICIVIFAATGIITLLGLIKKVNIDRGFLKLLFSGLIVEIVTVGVLGFKIGIKNDEQVPQGPKAWEVTTKIHFLDKYGKPEIDKNLLNGLRIQQSEPSTILEKDGNRVRFLAVGRASNEPLCRDINLIFSHSDSGFGTVSYNLKLDSICKLDNKTGQMQIPDITLQVPLEHYKPQNININPTTNGPPIIKL